MIKFLEHRVADRRILRLIQKWLNAGVMEDGQWLETKMGTPQGSVISPLLANIYLHYAFDQWVDAWRKKCARGDVIVIRYADDTVLGFQAQAEADRFLQDLGKRLGKFGLELHPEKTRRIEFGRFAEANRERRGEGKPETFEGVFHGEATDDRQAHEGEAAGDQAATPTAHARSGAANWEMAPVGRAGLLQLPRGTGKPRQSGGFPGKGNSTLATVTSPSRPATPDHLGSLAPIGRTMATPTASAPPLPRGTLRRHASTIRASCGNPARGDPCGGR